MQNLILTTPENLKQLFHEVLEEHQKKVIKQTSEKEAVSKTKYYTCKEVATELHISLPTLNKYVKEGIIPCHRIGRRVLFKQEDMENAPVKRKFK